MSASTLTKILGRVLERGDSGVECLHDRRPAVCRVGAGQREHANPLVLGCELRGDAGVASDDPFSTMCQDGGRHGLGRQARAESAQVLRLVPRGRDDRVRESRHVGTPQKPHTARLTVPSGAKAATVEGRDCAGAALAGRLALCTRVSVGRALDVCRVDVRLQWRDPAGVSVTASSRLETRELSAEPQLRLGLAYPGDPESPGTWSGTPASLAGALRELGATVVPLRAEPPRAVEWTAAHAAHAPSNAPNAR